MANSIQYKLYLPPGFLDKRINEQVIFDFVDQVRHYSVWRRGDPLQKEPDFVCDGAVSYTHLGSSTKYAPCWKVRR